MFNIHRNSSWTHLLIALAIIFTHAHAFAKSKAAAKDVTKNMNWRLLARQVGSAEKTRDRALDVLRKIPDLDPQLLAALQTPSRSLALDVIATLGRVDLIPDLLERVSADEDGFLVLALNSMISEKTKSQILDAYVEKLAPGKPAIYSPAALIAMLEPLGRLGVVLPKETVTELLDHPFPEVRSSALGYIRVMTLMVGNRSYADLILKAVRSQPMQLRLEAMYLIDEIGKRLPGQLPIDLNQLNAACEHEKKPSVRDWCFAVAARRSKS